MKHTLQEINLSLDRLNAPSKVFIGKDIAEAFGKEMKDATIKYVDKTDVWPHPVIDYGYRKWYVLPELEGRMLILDMRSYGWYINNAMKIESFMECADKLYALMHDTPIKFMSGYTWSENSEGPVPSGLILRGPEGELSENHPWAKNMALIKTLFA